MEIKMEVECKFLLIEHDGDEKEVLDAMSERFAIYNVVDRISENGISRMTVAGFERIPDSA